MAGETGIVGYFFKHDNLVKIIQTNHHTDSVLQQDVFQRLAKPVILRCETDRFRSQNGIYCFAVNIFHIFDLEENGVSGKQIDENVFPFSSFRLTL